MGLKVNIEYGALVISDDTKNYIEQLQPVINIYSYNANDTLGTPPNLELVDKENRRVELEAAKVDEVGGVGFSGDITALKNAIEALLNTLNAPALPSGAATLAEQQTQTTELQKLTAHNRVIMGTLENATGVSFNGVKRASWTVLTGTVVVQVDTAAVTFPVVGVDQTLRGSSFEVDNSVLQTPPFNPPNISFDATSGKVFYIVVLL